jgi:hypothetical protein
LTNTIRAGPAYRTIGIFPSYWTYDVASWSGGPGRAARSWRTRC